ncbi:hypothetical protein QYF61_017258 [Mycteria americana]|uniref:Androglobin n=1 Tax=Mycteria americana TaxID=33587 RepID=A0AAN7PE04_MYCAM|nr:hypothetical protein QYF61_017258 [Mycteria americana]
MPGVRWPQGPWAAGRRWSRYLRRAGSPGNAADAAGPAAMASKGSKKKELGSRNSSGLLGASAKEATMSSHVGASNEKWRFPIWPEWNEADINAEKWDAGKVGKEKEKTGKSPISGCWRKIIVDDTMPFNEEDNLLLPATTCQIELWPMLLSKAIIKLANTRPGYLDKVWGFLKEIVPEFKLPNKKTPELDIPQSDTKPKETKVSELKNEVSSVNKQSDKPEKAEKADKIGKEELHDNISFDAKRMSETADTGTNSQTGDKSKEEMESERTSVSRETWISFEDFCVCFQNLYVFHKPHTYAYNYQKTDFKSTDDRVFYYLFVDSLMPIEILVSFSALVRWDDTGGTKQECSSISKGVLMVEHFSWKCVTPGELLLKMHTSATKATVLNLPVGRHILLFTVSSPIGHHIHLCSMVPCVFGEEDTVMPGLEKESYRFIEQATAILKAVGNVINNFSSKPELSNALKELELTHCPPGLHGTGMAEEHFKVFNSAFWYLIKYVLGKKAPYSYKFAFRSFTLDFKDIEVSEDDTVSSESCEKNSLNSWQNQTPTSEEEAAALKLQAIWRGTYVRKVLNSRKPGTKENANVKETLQKLWTAIELNFEQCAVMLLREMFKRNCKSIEKFPCYEDEWCKVSFVDYAVTYADQPPNVWFVVFREIFFVPEDMLIVPKVYTTIPSCRLHVVDNDTLEEMPYVFFKVAPHVYPKNKKGYTFMAEARTGDLPVAAGRWRLRLISSHSPLPFLSREAVNNVYSTKEIKEYYIPNDSHVMFRYSVKVTASHIATVQVQTSKSDVFIKLQVLDKEEEIVSVTGKGHAVIPAFNFLSNETLLNSHCKYCILYLIILFTEGYTVTLEFLEINTDIFYHLAASKTQIIQSSIKKESETGGSKKKGHISSSKDTKTSFKPGLVREGPPTFEDESFLLENFQNNDGSPQRSHKYIIQALVLYNSWPLTESQSLFVQELKEMEKNEIKGRSI